MSARYTHRVAISNNRLVSMDNGKVRFRWKDYAISNRRLIAFDETGVTFRYKDYVRREGAGG